jgi:hypothetical protein
MTTELEGTAVHLQEHSAALEPPGDPFRYRPQGPGKGLLGLDKPMIPIIWTHEPPKS